MNTANLPTNPGGPDRPLDLSRTLILGNSGSGKSRLAAGLSRATCIPAIDLDAIHWEPGGYDRKRDADRAIGLVRDAAAGPRWIIEGVYGWLAREAMPRATALLWLDLAVEECLANIRRRGPRRGGGDAQLASLLAWAADYCERRSSSSLSGHAELFAGFTGGKCRLASRDAVDAMLKTACRHRRA